MLFDKTIEGLTALIYYTGLRHKVIANNIANIDTPNYKALDITFADQLRLLMKAQGSGRLSFLGNLKGRNLRDSEVTSGGAFPPPTTILAPYLSDQRPRIELNTVDIDQEQVKLAQNTILHNSCLQLLISKFRILKSGISGNV